MPDDKGSTMSISAGAQARPITNPSIMWVMSSPVQGTIDAKLLITDAQASSLANVQLFDAGSLETRYVWYTPRDDVRTGYAGLVDAVSASKISERPAMVFKRSFPRAGEADLRMGDVLLLDGASTRGWLLSRNGMPAPTLEVARILDAATAMSQRVNSLGTKYQ